MLFDRLCRLAERSDAFAPLRPQLEQARIFLFPRSATTLPKSYTDEQISFHSEFFHLPFPVVSIEDPTSCVVLWDTAPNQQGWAPRRFTLEFAPLSTKHAATWRDAEDEREFRATLSAAERAQLENLAVVKFGCISDIVSVPLDSPQVLPDGSTKSHTYTLRSELFGVWTFEGKDHVEASPLLRDPEHERLLTLQAGSNAMSAVEEFMQFNAPDRFILESGPVKPRKVKAGRLLRSDDRPNYTLLRPSEIREKMGLEEPVARGKRRSHERRRHVRRYPEDPARWPNAHGKTKVIPASWIGPHEAVVGRHYYKVLLDR